MNKEKDLTGKLLLALSQDGEVLGYATNKRKRPNGRTVYTIEWISDKLKSDTYYESHIEAMIEHLESYKRNLG